jgi:hypothetical protein
VTQNILGILYARDWRYRVSVLTRSTLADIRNTRRISAVVANGRFLDRATLDAMLATAERMARSGKHDVIHRPRPGRALK